jgi:osmotically-inducible protein OsmY
MGSENRLERRHRRSSERRGGHALWIRIQLLGEGRSREGCQACLWSQRSGHDIEVKLFWQRTDPEVARDAVHELESHVSIPSEQIKVTVKNGWVTLEGTVDWEYQKNLAKSAVNKLKGVTGVTNNIKVQPKISPTEVKARIEEALRRSAELDARRITVEVDGSTVRLYGGVSSWAEKDEAERAAWSAPGTENVESHIIVNP